MVAIHLWPDEREALTEMRQAGKWVTDEEVLRSALWLLALKVDAPIYLGPDTFQLGRQLPLFGSEASQ